MTNREIYRKTIGFSIRRLLWDMMAFILMAGLAGGGYLLAEKLLDKGLIGLAVGALVGIVAVFFLLRYGSYTFKAA